MSEVTKEQIIEKHLKSYLSKNYPENLISEYVVKAYTEWEWISNAMDEWGQLQVNKNLHKPAVMESVCDHNGLDTKMQEIVQCRHCEKKWFVN